MAELASTAVDGIRASEAFNSGTTAMRRYMGEALVLRSLSYFELVRRWGDIPFKEGMSNSDLSNVYMGKINRDSIYACIVKDMQEAIEYLPWVGEVADYNSERITKGFAKGMLARIALLLEAGLYVMVKSSRLIRVWNAILMLSKARVWKKWENIL